MFIDHSCVHISSSVGAASGHDSRRRSYGAEAHNRPHSYKHCAPPERGSGGMNKYLRNNLATPSQTVSEV